MSGAERAARRGRRRRGESPCAPSTTVNTTVFGGRYEPLTHQQVERIHQAALNILETIGLSDAPPDTVDFVLATGGRRKSNGRLTFAREQVMAALDQVAKPLVLCGQDPNHDLRLEGSRVYTGTGGAAPTVLDIDTQRYRPSTLRDLYDAARVADALSHVHFFSRSLVARDVEGERALDLNTAFASLVGTSKHVMVSASQPEHVSEIAEMCYAIAGSEPAFRARPFLSLNINHVVPPLRWHPESCQVLAAALGAGIPVLVNVFGQLGASSPVTIAGSVAQTVAETLAGVVLAWSVDTQAKVIAGPRPMITDLRTGAMSGGSGEQALATAAAVQMMRWYGLPNSTIAGATDSKLPDAQAGYEKALSVAMAVHCGANLVTQSCGMQAGLMGVSFEAYVIDNDMLGAIARSAAAIEVTDTTLAIDTIAEVVDGEGHFLGQPETYARMKTDFLYPEVADRRSTQDWENAGAPDVRDDARAMAKHLLATHFPDHLSADLRRQLRGRFDLAPDDDFNGGGE